MYRSFCIIYILDHHLHNILTGNLFRKLLYEIYITVHTLCIYLSKPLFKYIWNICRENQISLQSENNNGQLT